MPASQPAAQPRISFDVSDEEFDLIASIVDRAFEMARSLHHDVDRRILHMDLSACIANGCPLQLAALLAAEDTDFAHDVFGIRRHIDRTTGKLGDSFVPRFNDLARAAPDRDAKHYAVDIDRSDEGLPPFNHNLIR